MTRHYDSPFGSRAQAAHAQYGPLCVGIDPHKALLDRWELPDTPDGLRTFAFTTLEALEGACGFVKPQSAFFERHGSAGIAVLEDVLQAAYEAGIITILDVKRGDIGSTMAGYAQSYCEDDAPLAADAITVSPFLGAGSLQPAVDLALANNRGLFALCLTSNPEGASVQHAVGPSGKAVAADIVDFAGTANAGAEQWGSFGLVVGATVKDAARTLGCDFEAAKAPLLVPGIGAQGATAEDVRMVFGQARTRVIASASRSILSHGPQAQRMKDAVLSDQAELAEAVK